ncbi:exonuclease SbcCD subunit D [Paenarthrobacter nicotinovorans]|uniref:exonuclease SbcCD subunit D n=1 Tax=Paenarthrobacter nicotinovorans TaxID=29320 RepID=UPI0016685F5A|nr:exonuclease SbcCD subunit D [Paenarthrobacter nicotinovorans]MBP2396170.1 exonuclease SbcD [Paenarthrobacter nicotinovorans]UKE97746.1 exonuclease SbcCD subunit D [Paenarthrobacter nicotinovorans]UKF02532.1 exonuclease SbcCD subunit D [Paenarthrobacter nicotinovorans]GGV19809.1 nuclease SbcCD subunit D [Paenarthrobacter nicotinovorans]
MRLLHTSDWHLGRSFHGVGMLEAQRGFVDQLVTFVDANSVDVVLIAGDVYDRALPGLDVVTLLDDALVRLTRAGASVVLTSGNHDSAIRLGFASRLLERGGVHLRTRVEDLDSPIVFPFGAERDAPGQVAIYGIPFLEPRLVAERLGVDSANHFDVTQQAVGLIKKDVERRRESGPVYPVVLAHTFASGGITSESERDLSIGGLGAVPLDLFEGFTYTALGHLHGRQQLAGNVRYSGSPLAYSFSEAKHSKGAWLVDINPSGDIDVQEVVWEAPKTLAVLRGTLDELLESGEYAWAEEAYCQITITDAQRPTQAMERLRVRFPDTLVLSFDPEGAGTRTTTSYSDRLAKAQDDLGVCCGFLEHVRDRGAGEAEEAALREALEAVRLEEAEL